MEPYWVGLVNDSHKLMESKNTRATVRSPDSRLVRDEFLGMEVKVNKLFAIFANHIGRCSGQLCD